MPTGSSGWSTGLSGSGAGVMKEVVVDVVILAGVIRSLTLVMMGVISRALEPAKTPKSTGNSSFLDCLWLGIHVPCALSFDTCSMH